MSHRFEVIVLPFFIGDKRCISGFAHDEGFLTELCTLSNQNARRRVA
jgi:hypothetical protein